MRIGENNNHKKNDQEETTATSKTRASPVATKRQDVHEKPSKNKDDQSAKESKLCYYVLKAERRICNQGCKYKQIFNRQLKMARTNSLQSRNQSI